MYGKAQVYDRCDMVHSKVDREYAKHEREGKINELCSVRAKSISRKKEVPESHTVRIKREKPRNQNVEFMDERDEKPSLSNARHYTFVKGREIQKKKKNHNMTENLEARYSEFGGEC